jgi:hypothetical protein
MHQRDTLALLKTSVSCHDPCDDPFWLKAWAKEASGAGMKGVNVTFSFTLKSGPQTRSAPTGAGGYAHVHVQLTPATAPQGGA